MPSNWTRMTKQDAYAVLDRLAGHADAVIFMKETTEVSVCNLPFYSGYKLYRLVNYATLPVFSLMYLSNGEEFIHIDGTAMPIYEVNQKAPIRLNEMNVIPYLDFFFGNVQGSEGDVFLIKDPRRAPFLEALTGVQRQSVIDTFRPLRVAHDPDTHVFSVSGTIYYGGGLLAATIQVMPDGQLAFQEQSLLLSGIYFPPEPYSQAWLEG